MKHWKYIAGSLLALSFTACSDKVMDEINKDVNDPKNVAAVNEIPAVTTETAVGTTGTDLAWYSSVFIEHNAGTYGQMQSADNRTQVTGGALGNNNWNSLYDNLMILQDIMKKCSPDGKEPNNKITLGIAQVLTAYNIAVGTDMWGQVPFKEALKGLKNLEPTYDKQQDIYKKVILPLLDSAIRNFSKPVPSDVKTALVPADFIYKGDASKWTKAAWSLKARYFLHLRSVDATADDAALDAISKGFSDATSEMLYNVYTGTVKGANPWYLFTADRSYLSAGKTLFDIMVARKDPRMKAYFTPYADDGSIVPAPNGTAKSSQQQFYSVSLLSWDDKSVSAKTTIAPTPLMTFHELKFIQAEIQARKGQDFKPALKAAIAASFAYHKVDSADYYYTNSVLPLLGTTQTDNLKEIMTQKYIASYEAESIEAYNDYRRTRIPTLNNPFNNNSAYGFVERFPYPTSEISSNPKNVPKVNIFKDKIWWAGGTE